LDVHGAGVAQHRQMSGRQWLRNAKSRDESCDVGFSLEQCVEDAPPS
jgi:hypothetical protein